MRGQLIKNTYRVDRVIGEGGMGAVYEVTQVRTGKRYALKVIKPEALKQASATANTVALDTGPLVTTNPALGRFRREAEALGRLRHANVISIHNFDELEGGAFLVMDLLEGEDLSQRLARERRLVAQDALRIFTQIASALEAAHEAGIIHRDLKPANVFLARQPGADERAVVIDFGLAKEVSVEETQKLTATGIVMGTPEYMSLEQASGRPLDARADLYALATILFEMLIGRTPFYAPTLPALFSKLMNEPPPSLHRERAELPPALDAVMARALAKSRDDRYPSARALSEAVHAAFDGERTPLTPTAAMSAPVAPTAPFAAGPIDSVAFRAGGAASSSSSAALEKPRRRVGMVLTIAAGLGVLVCGSVAAIALAFGFATEDGPEIANYIAGDDPPTASAPEEPAAVVAPREAGRDAGSCATLLGCMRSCDPIFGSTQLDERFRGVPSEFEARSGRHEATPDGLLLGGNDRLATIRSIPRFVDDVTVCIEAHVPRTLPAAQQHEAIFSLRNPSGAGIVLALRGTDRRIGLLNMRPYQRIERQDAPWLGEERDVRILISLRNHRLYVEVQRVDTGETHVFRTAYPGPTRNLFVELEMAADRPMRVDRVQAGSPSSEVIAFLP